MGKLLGITGRELQLTERVHLNELMSRSRDNWCDMQRKANSQLERCMKNLIQFRALNPTCDHDDLCRIAGTEMTATVVPVQGQL